MHVEEDLCALCLASCVLFCFWTGYKQAGKFVIRAMWLWEQSWTVLSIFIDFLVRFFFF